MRPHQHFIFLLLALLSLLSCNQPAVIERSYYFWQNTSSLDIEERNFLKQHQVHKLYAKLLDVDWSEVYGAIPVSENNLRELNIELNSYDTLHVNVVPVVFITNRTFERIDTSQLSLLAIRILSKCIAGYESSAIASGKQSSMVNMGINPPNEIQIDCDWTASTSKKYFTFLGEVKKMLPASVTLSSTIRLHQYKYPSKTGVPPVDRGMLMLYNISDPKKYDTVNSIFDYDKANAYFTGTSKYALPLDVVLPAFSWSLIFRNHQFYQIEHNISETDLMKMSFLQKEKNGFYRVTTDTVFNDVFLRYGDEIKPEQISAESLRQAATLAHKAINSKKYSVAFFELSANEIKKIDSSEIEKTYNSF